jgi:hypothetical protein
MVHWLLQTEIKKSHDRHVTVSCPTKITLTKYAYFSFTYYHTFQDPILSVVPTSQGCLSVILLHILEN